MITRTETWDRYFMNLLEPIASKSKDPSSKIGAIIVYPDHAICATGFNGFPRGVLEEFRGGDLDPELRNPHKLPNEEEIRQRWDNRAIKYLMVEHAERNAITSAAKHGHITNGCTIYVGGPSCADCTKAIIQAGIVKVVHAPGTDAFKERWADHIHASNIMFREAGVAVECYQP